MCQYSTQPALAQRAALLEDSPIGSFLGLAGQPGLISLAGGIPDARYFALDAVARAARRVLRRQRGAALQYAACAGIAPLREWVAAHLRGQGLAFAPEQILITSGSQQALDLLGKVLVDPASPLLVQRPTYLGALQAFAPYAPRFVGLECDEQGPRLQDFVDALPGARMAYLQPHFANPGGHGIGVARAEALASALKGRPCWLVEDDAYGQLWFEAPPQPGLLSRGISHGAHVGTFSKMVFPGLRLGWVAAREPLLGRLLLAKQAADLGCSCWNQWVLLDMLEHGVLEDCLPRLRALYRSRRDAMLEALERHMPECVRWSRPRGGLFVWLEMPRRIDGEDVAHAVRKLGVVVVPGRYFDCGAGGCARFGDCCDCRFAADAQAAAPARHTLRLSYATASARAIDIAVERLAVVLRDALRATAARVPVHAATPPPDINPV